MPNGDPVIKEFPSRFIAIANVIHAIFSDIISLEYHFWQKITEHTQIPCYHLLLLCISIVRSNFIKKGILHEL